jgi:hypothetical protein
MVSNVDIVISLEMCLLYTCGILPISVPKSSIQGEKFYPCVCLTDERGKAWRGAGFPFWI